MAFRKKDEQSAQAQGTPGATPAITLDRWMDEYFPYSSEKHRQAFRVFVMEHPTFDFDQAFEHWRGVR